MIDAPLAPKAGLFTRLLLRITAVNEAILRSCPQSDWDNVRAVGEIMLCTWLYQTALFAVISHRIFSPDGQVLPQLIIIAMFLASFILLIDSFMVMRSGWHLSGIEELKRGGLDISGGPWARIKANSFLAIRLFLSVDIAQLTAVFLSLIVFEGDIDARLHDKYLQANAHLLPAATKLVDDGIRRAADAVKTESVRETALSDQISALRQIEIDPSGGDLQIRFEQQEITQLLAQKDRADAEKRAAELFASNELAGIKGAPDNSGQKGAGPVRQAALEQVANARNEAQQIDSALAAAKGRLDSLQRQATSASSSARQRSQSQLPKYQAALDAETAKLSALKNDLAHLTQGRADAISAAVEKAPDHVDVDRGLLAQITALEQIAEGDRKIAFVILLIDFTSFGFELASVLAKVTSFVPMRYAALLARDAYMSSVSIVDGMMAQLSKPDEVAPVDIPPAEAPPPESRDETPPPDAPARSINPGYTAPPTSDPFAITGPAAPRPRGRPRKTAIN